MRYEASDDEEPRSPLGRSVGQTLRRARRAAGMTQRELASAARTSQAAVARYETSRVLPDLWTLERLLATCGHTLALEVWPTNGPGQESAARRPGDVRPESDEQACHPGATTVKLPAHLL